MKRFFAVFLMLFLALGNAGAETVINTLTTTSPLDTFPVTKTQYQKGGVITWITNVTQLNDLTSAGVPKARRDTNMVAINQTDGRWYQWDGTTWNARTPIADTGGFATNTFLNSPSITNLASFSLTQPAYYGFGSAVSGNRIYTIGDSFTAGSAATTGTNMYPYLVKTALGLSLTNIANSSFTIPDANWSMFKNWYVTNSMLGLYNATNTFFAPTSILETDTYTDLIGFNDVRTAGTTTTAYRFGLDHLLHYQAIPDTAKQFAQNGAVTTTGSWTNLSWFGGGTIGKETTSGTMTFSNLFGTEVYLGYIAWATNFGGTINVTVDGVAQTPIVTPNSCYGNRSYPTPDANIPPQDGPYGTGAIDFCPQLLTVGSLPLRSHVIVVTVSGGDCQILWASGNGFVRSARAGPVVFVGTIPRQYPWTGSGTDALQGAFNSQLIAAVSACRSAGLQVILAPAAAYYNPLTEQSGDGVHPNNAGHAAIANAFEANAGMALTALGSLSVQSDTAAGAGTFTSLSVSGTSSQVGNVTIGGRLLVLPTATPGGYNSRWGFGLSHQGTIFMSQYGDSTLDRSLGIYPYQMVSTLNSTNTPAPFNFNFSNLQILGTTKMFDTLTVTNGVDIATGGLTIETNSDLIMVGGKIKQTVDLSATNTAEGADTKTISVDQSGTSTYWGTRYLVQENTVGFGSIASYYALGAVGVTNSAYTNRMFLYAYGNAKFIAPATAFTTFTGDTTNSETVTIAHGDQTRDVHLAIVGNAIQATTNSTAQVRSLGINPSGGNVTISASGYNTAIAGSATVAQSLIGSGTNQMVSYAATGTGGAGFIALPTQSSAPIAPGTGVSLYADSSGQFSWIRGSDGFTRTLDATLTTNRVYTLLDTEGIIPTVGYDAWIRVGEQLGSAIKCCTLGINPMLATTTLTIATNICRIVPVWNPKTQNIKGIGYVIVTPGAYTPALTNQFGLYTNPGTNTTYTNLLFTAQNDNLWSAAAGLHKEPFTQVYTNLPSGLYFITYSFGNTAQTTAPTVAAGIPMAQSGLSSMDYTSVKLFSFLTAGTLPQTFGTASTSVNSTEPIFFLYQ